MRRQSANRGCFNEMFALTMPSTYERLRTLNILLAHLKLLDNPKCRNPEKAQRMTAISPGRLLREGNEETLLRRMEAYVRQARKSA
jgi:hypothetical protein